MVAKILGYLNTGRSKKAQSLNEVKESAQGKEKKNSIDKEQKNSDFEIGRGKEHNRSTKFVLNELLPKRSEKSSTASCFQEGN